MHHKTVLYLILLLGLAISVLVTPFDLLWTQYLAEHDMPLFSKFMKQSLFNREWPGASDLSIVIGLFVLSLYIYSQFKQNLSQRLTLYKPIIGYLAFTALTSPLLIHVVKIIINRPRPSLVFAATKTADWTPHYFFHPWYAFSSHFWLVETFSCSFPSGHTASAMYLLAISYALYSMPHDSMPHRKLNSIIFGVSVFIFACLMSVARAMTLHHWITDSIASIIIMFLFLHVSYFYILNIPQQIQYINGTSSPQKFPKFFELHLFIWILFCALGAVVFSQSIKEIFTTNLKPIWQTVLWVVFTIFGVALILIGSVKLWRYKRFCHKNVTNSNS